MKKILIIHTGGTFGMVPQKPAATLAPQQVQERITRHVPELMQIAEIDFIAPFNLDSANLTPAHWQALGTTIAQHMDMYDGFVIIHGTDSMIFTAAALSFMLQNLPKPVILTGSQRPLAEIRTDARMNLINAVELATFNIPEVCIFFGTELFRGNRAVKDSGVDYGAFISPNFPPLAEVGLEIRVRHCLPPPTAPLQFRPEISDAVLAFPYFPGLSPAHLNWIATSVIRVVVIEALGLGNVNVKDLSLVPFVEEMTRLGKLVVITSRSRHGFVDLSRYENGVRIAQAGAISAHDMTTEATLVKLMHLLGTLSGDIGAVREHLPIPLAGEIDPLR